MTDTQKQDRIGEMMREYREESRRQAHAASKVRESERDQQAALIASQARRIEELEADLAWYGEQARLARLIHSGGDAGRHALAADGGSRARAILNRGEG